MFGTAVPARSSVDEAPWITGLNDQQRAAVEHDEGPLLVVAGAGTGKTRTLASRVARLLAEGADPDRVLLLTFSRRASREMLVRAEHMGGSRAAARVWGGTFHAVANKLLRQHGHAVGLPVGFTILDHGDAADLMGVVRSELGFGDRERGARFPKKDTLIDIYSRVANAQERLVDTLRERFPWCKADVDDMRAVFQGYSDRKRSRGVLDYDDLLLYWRALVTASPAAEHMAARFDHLLVDEYQDTNVVQADIVGGLRPSGDGLFVVGDDAQAIYGFRAASAANMSAFTTRFPHATVVTLDRNYRSVQPVLDVANAVMSQGRGVFAKQLRTTREVTEPARPLLVRTPEEGAEAAYVCERVLGHREDGVALREQAVLFRSGHHSARLEMELSRRRIPFVKYGGLKFLEAAHVKDLLAFLRLLDNPSDELAWHRVLGLLDGVGPVTSQRVLEHLGLPNERAIRVLVDDPPEVPVRARADLDVVRAALATCLEREGDTASGPAPATDVEIVRTRMEPLFTRRYSSSAGSSSPSSSVTARLADLEQLQAMASACPSRSAFLAELTLDPPARTSDLAGPPLLDDDYLILTTIHSAKGGEWTVVYVIHASDGQIPSDMSLSGPDGVEEERRLFYVALTRARDHLYVTYPLRFYDRRHGLDDVHSYAQPSRFLSSASGLLDEPEVPVTAEALSEVPAGEDTVAAALSSLWA